jgi:uncharacterized RDD family membrane protein YckC
MSTQNENYASTQSNVYAPPEARVADVIPEGELVLATRLSRFAAQFIDGIIFGGIAIAGGLALGFSILKPDPQNALANQFTFFAFWVLSYLLVNGYFLYRDGQTLGKKAMSIRIVRADGSKAGFARILWMRLAPFWLLGQIPLFGPLLSLADPLFIFRESRKCLHDNIADTVVVRV